MDEGGYTEHSGCPIIDGEKWVITFWMRDGVSAEEPWDQFDPSGVRILTDAEYTNDNEMQSRGVLGDGDLLDGDEGNGDEL